MSYRRSRERNRRLKKLYNETKYSYGAGAWYDEDKGRYIKYSCGGKNYKKYLKKLCSKKARKYKGDMQNCDYKKTFDYWWELF